MINVQYEKPTMKFVDLRNRQVVADTDRCMAQGAQGREDFFYDIPGDGWVWIHKAKQSCSLQQLTYTYVDNTNVEGTISLEAQKAAEAAAQAAVEANKQQFGGEMFPESPDDFSQ